jgi:ubiquinone/menaquinone biosynthesis C-methylase UbiE
VYNERIAHYDVDYYTKRGCQEIQAWHRGIIRPGDMGAALCYAYGYPDYKAVKRVLHIPSNIRRWLPTDTGFLSQFEYIRENATRKPQVVVDIGAGRGEICALLTLDNVRAIGIDPSPGSAELFPVTMKEWAGVDEYEFLNVGMVGGLENLIGQGVDTIILCESIEHIPPSEFEQGFEFVKRILSGAGGLFIVTNWLDNHPIKPDRTGYDHIRRVDDELYDKLSKSAKSIVFRQGSHLVLEF